MSSGQSLHSSFGEKLGLVACGLSHCGDGQTTSAATTYMSGLVDNVGGVVSAKCCQMTRHTT